MASVVLAELDADYIAPSAACTRPKQRSSEGDTPNQRSRVSADPYSPEDRRRSALSTKLILEMEVDDGRPDLGARDVAFSAGADNGGAKKKKATVSLSDCLACSGCVTSAETVLISQQSTAKYIEAVKSGAFSIIAVSISPQSRAALAAHLGLTTSVFLPRLTTFWERIGAHYVTDTSVAADLALLETAAEFVARYRQQQPRRWAAPEASVAVAADRCRYVRRSVNRDGARGGDGATSGGDAVAGVAAAVVSVTRPVGMYTALPMLASACPGWICYAEKTQPSALPHISTAKSPQQTMGTLLKLVLGREMKVAPASIFHVTVMPCFDKKLEASRKDFFHEAEGVHEVDLVLTTGEVQEMLHAQAAASGLDPVAYFTALPEAAPPCSETGPVDALLRSNWASGSDRDLKLLAPKTTLGGSGGYLEFVFRYAAKELFNVTVSTASPLPYKDGRNDDVKELVLEVGGAVVLNFAIAYGFRNIQTIVQKMRHSRLRYHYVEVMACPSGCLNGGGQLREQTMETIAVRKARIAKVLVALKDGHVARDPFGSSAVKQLYDTALGGKPFSEAARKLLHTTYHAVPSEGGRGAGSVW